MKLELLFIFFISVGGATPPGWVADAEESIPLAGVAPRSFTQRSLLLGAHRGGRNLWPENTVLAYRQAAERWPDILLEGDVQMSADGHAVLIHDELVDRTTDGQGPVNEKTLAELQNLDAGYRFTPDGGTTFPFRGKGVRIPTLSEVLAAIPNHRILIEIKRGEGVAEAVARAVRAAHAESRFIVASINPVHMVRLKELAPELLTCFDYTNAMLMLKTLRDGDWTHYQPPCAMLSVPPSLEERLGLTPDEIEKIRGKGVIYQVFTLNKRAEIEHFLQRGVDSILSDNPALLEDVINTQLRASAKP